MLVTMSSRMESNGGFVTWAKFWWKWSKSSRGRVLSAAIAVSLPIAPRGSAPVSAIGAMSTRSSSSVYPKLRCRLRTDELGWLTWTRVGSSAKRVAEASTHSR